MNILITGGTGLVGNRLTEVLLEKGHGVRHLSRQKRRHGKVKNFQWNIDKNHIEEGALEDIHVIVHLAGESVADGRWTPERKKRIIKSRVDSANLLYQAIEVSNTRPTTFISASGIGIYGINTQDHLVTENTTRGEGFLADVVEKWEQSADSFKGLGIRVVKLRFGVVLSNLGGALVKMVQPIQYGLGAPLGNGKQYMSWIHIDDLAELIVWCAENEEVKGVYNAVAPNPVTNKELTQTIAKSMNKKLILPNVPSFVLKLLLGEMSTIVLGGNKVSSDRVSKSGFNFAYHNIKDAIDQILRKN